jgi:hypothetical protein
MATQAQLATMVSDIVLWFNSLNGELFTLDHADNVIAKPIIDAVTEQLGLQQAHVEWQGVAEFGLVPIFDYHEVTGKIFAYNIHPDGSIDSFNCD